MSRATSHLLVMMAIAGGVLLAGAIQKAPCVNDADSSAGGRATFACYSDIGALLRAEDLAGGRIPYLDSCNAAIQPCDEYPVVTMFTLYVTERAVGGSEAGFYWANSSLMLLCAVVIVWALERLNARTALFAAAPSLALYGTMNWDLIAVAAATIATYYLLRRRSISSGIALGIGAAAKLYPAALALPFTLHERRRDRTARSAWRLMAAAASTWAVINLPMAVLGTNGWLEVFRFNRLRGVDFESLWAVACKASLCPSAATLNVLIGAIVVGATAATWHVVTKRVPDEPRWFLSFPLLVFIVVSGKFWSPQYALWLLPWFALSRIPTRVWLAYQLSEVLEFVTRSAFMMDSLGSRVSFSWLMVTVVLRAALLLRCLWWWTKDPEPSPGVISDEAVAPVRGTAQPA